MDGLSDTPSDGALACEHLSVRVPGRTLVAGLSIRFQPGRIVAVLGRNGAGKSSTLHALAGLHAGATGEARVDGRALSRWPRRALARRLGLLTQANEDPFPGTVLDSVLVGRHPHIGFWQWEDEHDRGIARRALAAVDLADLDEREVASLSGGERRRLAVAAVLAQEPDVYLLDEPIQQLDPRHQVMVLEVFRRLADAGRTVVMSLHDAGLATRYADEALLLFGDGRWLHGDERDVLCAANIERLYGMPVRELTWSAGRTFVPA
ncbi:MAG TPA: ABC transporter ATP-binding protein [Steroidobacteraceae bacterium]